MSVKSENKNVEKRAGNSPDAKVEFGLLDPRTLLVETNVRAEVNLTPRFLKTIREDGVLTPILVHRTEQGLRVRAGQRRTLAAVEVGLEAIPAMIVQGDEDQVRRLREQLVENDDRQNLRHAERVDAFYQMSLLGVPTVEISNATGHSTTDVNAALKIAKTKKAKAVQAKYDLTLDQAAVLAEFENDTDAVKALTETAIKNPGNFAHAAQRRRDERDAAARMTEAVKGLAEAGIKQITNWSKEVHDNHAARELHQLQTGDGNTLSPEAHGLCPHRAAFLSTRYNGEIQTGHVCLDYKAAGHKLNRSNPNDTRTEQEKEEARAERAEVIANNKAWKSAETVRRQWLADFAKRKTTPKDAPVFLAETIIGDAYSIEKASENVHDLAREWLGLKTGTGLRGRQPLYDLIAKSTPARALHISLVLALAAIEARTGLHTWRRPACEERYFRALEAWGYTLADVEQIARGPRETPAQPAKQATPAKQKQTPEQAVTPQAEPALSPAAAAEASEQAKPKAANTPKAASPANRERRPSNTPGDDNDSVNPAKSQPATNTPKGTGTVPSRARTKSESAKPSVNPGTATAPKHTPEPATV
ncbi:ParB N-terminal domain-containing protein [Promicromonospora sp. NPDC057138]|uniref:ParB N-terminal domain-containing protein n=1 Tax=Promicromonospora sp. NPDC057138 TaxID=3346031 RepID=UPI00362AA0DA